MTHSCDILVIEDSACQAVAVRRVLERMGYTVHVATDGAAGWRLASSLLPRLIFLDVELPSLNGFQVLQRLKRQASTANIPVVMITSHDDASRSEQAAALGAHDFLSKHHDWQGVVRLADAILPLAVLAR